MNWRGTEPKERMVYQYLNTLNLLNHLCFVNLQTNCKSFVRHYIEIVTNSNPMNLSYRNRS